MERLSARRVARVTVRPSVARPGAVLLAHDGDADPSDGAHDAPAAALTRARLATALPDALGARGFVPRSLSHARAGGTPVTRGVFSC
jgi:hypothetical protein